MDDLFAGTLGIGFIIFIIAYCLITLVSWVKLFQKANEPSAAAIVPIWNLAVITKIVFGRGWLWVIPFLTSFIPVIGSFLSFFFYLSLYFLLGKVFGKSTGFCIGMVFLTPIFLIILAFDDSAYYQGPVIR